MRDPLLKASDIADILKLIDSSDFQHVRLQLGETKLEWHRKGAAGAERAVAAVTALVPEPPLPNPSAAKMAAIEDGAAAVTAPMLGVFWHASRPGDPPFAKPGDRVTAETTIGIIEVMKLMNTVPAGIAGTVTEIVAPNGRPVEFGQPLIRVRPE